MDIYEGLESESYDRSYKDSILLKRIFKYFRAYRGKVILIVLFVIIATVFEIAVPIIISKVVDVFTEKNDNNLVIMMCCGLIIIGILKFTGKYLEKFLSSTVVGNVVLNLRTQLYSKVLGMELSFFDTQSTGKIVNRIMNDTTGFANVITLIIELFSYLLIIICLSAWLAFISLQLTLLLVGMMFLAIIISLSFRFVARRYSRYSRQSAANISSIFQESINGIMTAKIFRQENVIYNNFINSNKQYYRINVRLGLLYCVIYPMIAIFSGAGLAVLVYAGSRLYQSGDISTGAWLLFIHSEAYFWYPMMKIASFWSMFQEGIACSERIFSLLDTEKTVKQTNRIQLNESISKFEFKDVTFCYDGREDLFRKFNLTVHSGEKVALVGHTGSGKTTLLKLLARYNEFQEGTILVNGTDIRKLDLDQYRRKLGIISQNPYLFSGTVKENILYGNDSAADEDLWYVITNISDGEWLDDFSNGLETDVGECGGMVSAGQQQLISLARIMLKNPDVLILDEATANIDPFTEAQIQDGLKKLMKNRTVIMVAHRISTLNFADRIIVLDHGSIIEQGTQEELIKKDGLYRKLHSKFYEI